MYLYPKWVRLWHWLNALLFIILIVTGISMQYTGKNNPDYMVSFSRAVKWHNIAAIILTFNYIFFVAGNIFTRNGRYYRIKREGFMRELIAQFKFYGVGMFKGAKHPFPVNMERKFNPLQKFTYVLAMYVAFPFLIISGIGLLFPEITVRNFFGVSGLIYTDVLHIALGFLLCIFMLIHIYTCTLGDKPSSLFWGMISGYHRSEHEE